MRVLGSLLGEETWWVAISSASTALTAKHETC